jgi:hypothetical protein
MTVKSSRPDFTALFTFYVAHVYSHVTHSCAIHKDLVTAVCVGVYFVRLCCVPLMVNITNYINNAGMSNILLETKFVFFISVVYPYW